MITALLGIPSWFWHPLQLGSGSACSAINHTGCGDAFWSGIGSDVGEVTLLGIFGTVVGATIHHVLQHNCHVTGCKSILTSLDPTVSAPACSKHHSLGHLHGASHHRLHRPEASL